MTEGRGTSPEDIRRQVDEELDQVRSDAHEEESARLDEVERAKEEQAPDEGA